MTKPICLVTPYPPTRSQLGGGGWIDRRLHASLVSAGAKVSILSVTGPSGSWQEQGISGRSAGNLPLEVRDDRRALLRIAAAMAISNKPYLACKFTAFPGWSAAVDLLRQEAQGRSVVTSGWPPLLLACSAGVPIALHIAHNVDTVIAAQHAPRSLRLLGEVRRLRRTEMELLRVPMAISTLSQSDQHHLAQWGITAELLPLPVVPAERPAGSSRGVGFIGKASWPPNAEALEVLLGPVHEALCEIESTATFVLGGSGTDVHLGHARVARAGPVSELDEFYRSIGVVVVPRLGASTGVSIKVLEAAEYGVPAIVPRALASAIDPHGPWIVCENPIAIADAIASLADGSTSPPDIASWAERHSPERTAAHVLERVRAAEFGRG